MMPITVLTPLHHGTVSGRPSAGDSWRTTAATEMEASATRMRTRPNRTRLLGPGDRPAGLPRGRVRAPGRRRVPTDDYHATQGMVAAIRRGDQAPATLAMLAVVGDAARRLS